MEDDIEKFDKFLKSYSKYYQTVAEISMPCPTHEKNCPKIKQRECVSKKNIPLVKSDFKMYSFDDICRDSDTMDICNLPLSVDALHLDKKRRILYFIEFKGIVIDNFNEKRELKSVLQRMSNDSACYSKYSKSLKRVLNKYGDELTYKLRLKPFESINLALPSVYRDYCIKNNIDEKEALDIEDFLYNGKIRKFYIVVAISNKNNPAADRANSYRYILRKPFNRLKELGFVDFVEIMDHNEFKCFLDRI